MNFYHLNRFTIPRFLDLNSDALEPLFVTLTMVDSEPEPSKFRYFDEREAMGPFVVLPFREFELRRREHNLLNGFDEMFLSKEYPFKGPPMSPCLVSPCDTAQDLPSSFQAWFDQSSYLIGLGDGLGLTIVTANLPVSESGHLDLPHNDQSPNSPDPKEIEEP